MAGIVAPIVTGWLLHVGGSYNLAIETIFALLLLGAFTTVFLLRRDWSARLMEQARSRSTDAPRHPQRV